MIITPPTIALRTRPELSSFVIDTIEGHKVRVPPGSRLRRMHDLYHSGLGTLNSDHPDYEIALEGERDMQLLGFAFDQLAGFQPSETYRDLLKKIVKDSALPQNDRSNSFGRDAAFEVYTGAICQAAQLLPVVFEEPDLSFVLDGTKYVIAAKRIKNLTNLFERISKGAKQIDRSGHLGIIVLDVGLAFNPENRRLRRMSDTQFWSEYEANFHDTWSQSNSRVQSILAKSQVLGIVVHDYHVRETSEGWQLTGATIRVSSESRSHAEQSLFNKISTLYTYALPNQHDAESRALILPTA